MNPNPSPSVRSPIASQHDALVEVICTIRAAIEAIDDEALAVALGVQVAMELLRTVDRDKRFAVGWHLMRIAANNLNVEEGPAS